MDRAGRSGAGWPALRSSRPSLAATATARARESTLSLLHSEIRGKRVYAQVCALNGVVVCTVQDPTITRSVFGNPISRSAFLRGERK